MEEAKKNSRNDGMRNRRVWILVLAIIFLIFALISATLAARIYFSTKNAKALVLAPNFLLRDEMGRLTSLKQFRGKVVVLAFIDPVCRHVCPDTTHSMVEALNILGPAAASQVQLLAIDANPEKTRISDVAAYTRLHGMEGSWRFLTGSVAELKRVWRAYNVYVAVKNDNLEHSTKIILIDRNGYRRKSLPSPINYENIGDQAHILAAAIAQLLPGHPTVPVSSGRSGRMVEPFSEVATVKLISLGPRQQRVALGSTHPHLLLFFAGWLEETPELSKNLAVLDSYAALARQRGWPSPVAVDELTTESSPDEARRLLVPVAAGIRTPIVEDVSGRLADSLRVDELPWFVLTTASGNILWHHDGWLSAAELNRQVRAALGS